MYWKAQLFILFLCFGGSLYSQFFIDNSNLWVITNKAIVNPAYHDFNNRLNIYTDGFKYFMEDRTPPNGISTHISTDFKEKIGLAIGGFRYKDESNLFYNLCSSITYKQKLKTSSLHFGLQAHRANLNYTSLLRSIVICPTEGTEPCVIPPIPENYSGYSEKSNSAMFDFGALYKTDYMNLGISYSIFSLYDDLNSFINISFDREFCLNDKNSIFVDYWFHMFLSDYFRHYISIYYKYSDVKFGVGYEFMSDKKIVIPVQIGNDFFSGGIILRVPIASDPFGMRNVPYYYDSYSIMANLKISINYKKAGNRN